MNGSFFMNSTLHVENSTLYILNTSTAGAMETSRQTTDYYSTLESSSVPGTTGNDIIIPTHTASTPEPEGIMSDELNRFFEIMNFVILSGIISFMGSIFNIINVIVFIKQGLKDSISISLLGLAISDFGALVTLAWMSVCFNPYFADSDIPFNSPRVQYLTAGWPHVCFARITSFITAYITLERCLCIVMPLRVKNIITPRRTVLVIVSIFLTLIASIAPVYYAIRLDWVFNEDKNRTLIDLVYVEDGEFIENVSFSFNVFSQLSSFVTVIICSIVLVHCLRRNSKWRQGVMSMSDSGSVRDKKVVKMVLFLATIFIVCFLPSAVNLIIMISSSEYSIVGRYSNIFQTSWSFLNTLEAANSSFNIFIYHRMSTNYRRVFRRTFCHGRSPHSESETTSQ